MTRYQVLSLVSMFFLFCLTHNMTYITCPQYYMYIADLKARCDNLLIFFWHILNWKQHKDNRFKVFLHWVFKHMSVLNLMPATHFRQAADIWLMGFKLVLNTVHLLRAEPCLSALLSLGEILRMSKWMMFAVRTPDVSRGNNMFLWGPKFLSCGTDRFQVDLSPFTLNFGKT